jgi:hypothetical protein
MLKKNLRFIFLTLLIIDISYSFIQHSNTELDGDMADHILPSHWYQKVLDDPFGLNVLLKNEVYAGPNRFFSHWIYSKYFKVVPLALQKIFNPVDSIYISCAIAKTAIQIFLILLLAAYISGKKNIFSKEFLMSAILVAPFFITYKYYRLGIIDRSITLTFFYALPLGLLLLFFLPFFKKLFYNEEIKTGWVYRACLFLLSIIISLSGPLIPAVVLIVCPAVLIDMWYHHFKEPSTLPFIHRAVSSLKKIPNDFLFYFILVSALSLYSLYIGKNNIENTTTEISLSDRYALLANGLTGLLTWMPLLIPLIIMIAINSIIIIKYFNNDNGRKILNFLKWIIICSIIYIMLLPLGGFRSYRPLIIRYDTMMPVTLSLIIIFGLTVNFLILNLSGKFKIIFSTAIIIFLLVYCFEDKPTVGENKCERNALYEISESEESIVLVSGDCSIMSWGKISDPKDSELNAELLKYWGITKEKKLYYQK